MKKFLLYITIITLTIFKLDSLCNYSELNNQNTNVQQSKIIEPKEDYSILTENLHTSLFFSETSVQNLSGRGNYNSRVKQNYFFFTIFKEIWNNKNHFFKGFNIYYKFNTPSLSLGYKSLVLRL